LEVEASHEIDREYRPRKTIPAIFLYREASGEKYAYNILDGKQRLESLILFIGDQRPSLVVRDFRKYFFDPKSKSAANFAIQHNAERTTIADLDESVFRDFRDYVIPTIEISLSDDEPTSLDEMIDLFVDINSYGERVKRFDIVKAISKDKLLSSTFKLIAVKQKRGRDVFYKYKNNEFTRILKRLQVVANIENANSKVDRMWELLVELVLFLRTLKHRTPVEILKNFIKSKGPGDSQAAITAKEAAALRKVFRFLAKAYENEDILNSRLSTNQIHFYTMVTSIIADDLLGQFDEDDLIENLAEFGKFVDGEAKPPRALSRTFSEYQELSAKHTTHPGRRGDRQEAFRTIIEAL